jgi:hypothetical protein
LGVGADGADDGDADGDGMEWNGMEWTGSVSFWCVYFAFYLLEFSICLEVEQQKCVINDPIIGW